MYTIRYYIMDARHKLYVVYCTLYSVRRTLCSFNYKCVLCLILCTLIYCVNIKVHLTLYNVHCILYNIFSLSGTLYHKSPHCTILSLNVALYLIVSPPLHLSTSLSLHLYIPLYQIKAIYMLLCYYAMVIYAW